ncbi:lipopolysaccharide transport periplasmic protein LptA [Ectothiorhodospiraceae bacterium 2226]|nr:lipopolysaccharide transport periplasmic protein LptA [Ectothiorhodospiraceae bacterium 2226]
MPHPSRPTLGVLGLALALGVAPALAQSPARDAPIHLQADQVTLDERAGVSTYQGNVVLTQATLRIEADEVRVESEGREVIRMVARGAPARFQENPPDQPALHAEAASVEYRAREGVVVLLGDAQLRQGEDTVTGHRIEYDSQDAVVRASGEGREPVRAVLHPRQAGDADQ